MSAAGCLHCTSYVPAYRAVDSEGRHFDAPHAAHVAAPLCTTPACPLCGERSSLRTSFDGLNYNVFCNECTQYDSDAEPDEDGSYPTVLVRGCVATGRTVYDAFVAWREIVDEYLACQSRDT